MVDPTTIQTGVCAQVNKDEALLGEIETVAHEHGEAPTCGAAIGGGRTAVTDALARRLLPARWREGCCYRHSGCFQDVLYLVRGAFRR